MKLRPPPRFIQEVFPKNNPKDHHRLQDHQRLGSTVLTLIIWAVVLAGLILGSLYWMDESGFVERQREQTYEKPE